MYQMPEPKTVILDDDLTEIRLVEYPPGDVADLAREIAAAAPDTIECRICGARVGHIREAVAGVADVDEWVTPWLALDGVLCDICGRARAKLAEDEDDTILPGAAEPGRDRAVQALVALTGDIDQSEGTVSLILRTLRDDLLAAGTIASGDGVHRALTARITQLDADSIDGDTTTKEQH